MFAGSVSSAAAGLKDRVTGLYSGGETGSAANTGEGLSKPGIEYEDAVSFILLSITCIPSFKNVVPRTSTLYAN